VTDAGTLKDVIGDNRLLLEKEEQLVDRENARKLVARSGLEIVEIATGVRRAGKTKVLLLAGRALKSKGKKVHYIDFEDERIEPDEADFQKISSMLDLEGSTVIVDEPQNMPKWEKWIRRLHGRGVKVFVTGSNSKLLGKEFSSALGGRKKTHEIFPFSFKEYLAAKKTGTLPADQVSRELDNYLQGGGFPYPVLSGDYSVLSDYRSDIIEKDIVARHKIRDASSFRSLARFVLSNPGLYLSHKSVRGFLDISHVTIRKYLDHLADAYAVIRLEKFGFSQKERILNPNKVYPVDNGLLIKRTDPGRLLESCIVQHIRRKTEEFYYWKDKKGREIDIYLPGKRLAIQVVYELNVESLKREEAALESAVEKLKASPLVVYLHSNVETKYPSIRATEFLDKLDATI
jgi:hypothetical protein